MQKITDKKMKATHSSQRGFTLVETLVSMLIFTTIVIFGISALVAMSRNYRVTGQMRQSLDTMNYVMEDMSRNIRLGTAFVCIAPGDALASDAFTNFRSCLPTGAFQGSLGLALAAFDNSPVSEHKIIYMIKSGRLYKASFYSGDIISTDPTAAPFAPMTPDNVTINGARSGFSVYNNDSPNLAPAVSIRLSGTVGYQTTTVPFSIQTTIAPRNRQ